MKHTPETIKERIRQKVDGVWVADYDETGHYYLNTLTGVRVPSVTTKLGILKKEHLEKWKIKLAIEFLEQDNRFERLKTEERYDLMTGAQLAHKDVSGAAASAGSLTHLSVQKYIEFYLSKGSFPEDIRSGFLPGSDPQSIAGARSVEKWFKEKEIIPIATELLVGDESLNSAGQLDCLVLYGPKQELTLIDWKLANSIDDTYAVQVSTYRKMFQKMSGLKIKNTIICQLSKNYDHVTEYLVPNYSASVKAFKGLSYYYDWYHNGQKKTPQNKKIIKI